MNSELLKKIAAGEAFDLVEGVREIARVLTANESKPPEPRTNTGSGKSGGSVAHLNGGAPKQKDG